MVVYWIFFNIDDYLWVLQVLQGGLSFKTTAKFVFWNSFRKIPFGCKNKLFCFTIPWSQIYTTNIYIKNVSQIVHSTFNVEVCSGWSSLLKLGNINMVFYWWYLPNLPHLLSTHLKMLLLTCLKDSFFLWTQGDGLFIWHSGDSNVMG
jgi:hypothetical protein